MKVISIEGQVRLWPSVEKRQFFSPKIDIFRNGPTWPKFGSLYLSPLKSFDNDILCPYADVLYLSILKKSWNFNVRKGSGLEFSWGTKKIGQSGSRLLKQKIKGE